ncbi:hypothetical protein JWG40_19630, partial [Leptospira sp. 201903074]|nr:hypothetical protein [Leptospira abararensis]
VRDAVYSKNANLEYEFLGGFDNARKVVDNYVKNNLPGRSANEDPYALVNQSKGSVSSNASSIVTAGEEIGVIFNIKQQANGNYLAELQKYKDIYAERLADFDTAELGFKNQQTIVTAKQNEYNNKQEEVKTAYDLLEQSSREMSLLSSVYDYVTIKEYSTHDGISGESQAAITSPVDLVRKRYQDAEKAVTDKLAEITLLQKRADDRMKLNELQADTAVAGNKAEAEEWAERAMRFSIAETIVKNKMQDLQRQINDARNALDATMEGLVGPGLNPAIIDGRLDFNSYDYKYQETRLREFYKIADGMVAGKIGAWDFIHGSRGSVEPATYSGGLAHIHPTININGYMHNYNAGVGGADTVAAQRGFDGVWVLNAGAPWESAFLRRTSYSYGEFEAKMNYSLGNVMGSAMLVFAFLSLGNPMTGMEAINRNKAWIDSKIAIDNTVNTARSQAATLKSLQEELNRYTDISTGEQLIDMLKGGPAKGYVATGLEDSDVAFLTGASGQLKNGTINWTGGKEPLSVDRLVGKNGDPIIQKRAIKDSYGLFIRDGVAVAGSPSTNSNVGYANDGRMVNIMTSADEFVGSLASISKTQYTIEKEEYYASQEAAIVRGVKADKREILDDRDRFYSGLLAKVTDATGKNIEYDMYKTLVEDYYGQGNVADQLYALNEGQQREYQIKVWDNKEKDFQSKKADWIENVNYLMETGSARFNDMLTSFNQSWDQWRRDFKEETDKGKAEHMARIEEALKKKTDWEVSLLNQARKGDQFEIDQVYAEIQKTIANMGSAPNAVLLQNNANKILNTIMNSKPQVLDNRMLEQGMYTDVQFFVDELQKSKYDESNVDKMKSLTKEMEDRSKQMAVLQTLDSLWSLPLTFEATIAEQNKALDEQLSMQLLQDNFIKMGPGYVRSAVDKMGNPSYQVLPIFSPYLYIKPDKLPTVKDSNGKEWDLTDYQALQGKGGPASAELTMMVRLARNQMQTDFKLTYDPEKSENREVGYTMLDPKAMAKVARAAQSALGQLASDPQKMFEFNSADAKGREAMIESAKNSGYLVGPTVGGAFGTHHFNQYYPILKMKEKYNEIKAEGEALKGDGFANAAGGVLSIATGGLINPKQAAKFLHENSDVIDTITTVAAVVAAPFTGGASLLALAAYKTVKGAFEGGVLGAAAGFATIGNAALFVATAGTVSYDLSYSYAEGFGASIGGGYNFVPGLSLGGTLSYNEYQGFDGSVGVQARMTNDSSVTLNAGVSFKADTKGRVTGSRVDVGVGLGLGKNQSGGHNASLNLGLSYDRKEGFGQSAGISENTNKFVPQSSLDVSRAAFKDGTDFSITSPDVAGINAGVTYNDKVKNYTGTINANGASAFTYDEESGKLSGNKNFLTDAAKTKALSLGGMTDEELSNFERQRASGWNSIKQMGSDAIDGIRNFVSDGSSSNLELSLFDTNTDLGSANRNLGKDLLLGVASFGLNLFEGGSFNAEAPSGPGIGGRGGLGNFMNGLKGFFGFGNNSGESNGGSLPKINDSNQSSNNKPSSSPDVDSEQVRDLMSKEDLQPGGKVDKLIEEKVNFNKIGNESDGEQRNRIVQELRSVSETLSFDGQDSFNDYVAKMGNHMGKALDKMGYGYIGYPGNINSKGDASFMTNIDCSSFVSAVAYVSGVTYEFEKGHGFGLNGKDTMSADDIARRNQTETGKEKDGSYGGVQNMRYNSRLFIPTTDNKPIPGAIGMMKKYDEKLGFYSDHTYVVQSADDKKINIVESAGGGIGVQFSDHNQGVRYWNKKTTFWQLNGNYRPGLIRNTPNGN